MVVLGGGGLFLMSEVPLYTLPAPTLLLTARPLPSGEGTTRTISMGLNESQGQNLALTALFTLLTRQRHVHTKSRCVECIFYAEFIRMSICDKYTGSMKVTTLLDHASHCKTASGTNWSSRWTYRVFIINTRRDLITVARAASESCRDDTSTDTRGKWVV